MTMKNKYKKVNHTMTLYMKLGNFANFDKKCQDVCMPEESITTDEAICAFHGHIFFVSM
jgi:hypothetical protein